MRMIRRHCCGRLCKEKWENKMKGIMTDYEWLTEMGLCQRCRRERCAPGKKFCFGCLDKIRAENRRKYDPEKAREYQERRREIYREKKEKGICIRCSKLATHGLYCYECSIKAKRRSTLNAKKRREKRQDRGLIPEKKKAQGICLWCDNKSEPGLCCCSYHRKIFSDAGKKAHGVNLKNKNNPWINEVEAWKKKNNWMRSENT